MIELPCTLHNIAVKRINKTFREVGAVIDDLVFIHLDIIPLRTVADTVVVVKRIVVDVWHSGAGNRGVVYHIAGGAVFVGVVVAHGEILVSMPRHVYNVFVLGQDILKPDGRFVIGAEQTGVVLIIHSVACAETLYRGMFDDVYVYTRAVISVEQIFHPITLRKRELVTRARLGAFFKRHENKEIACFRFDNIVRFADGMHIVVAVRFPYGIAVAAIVKDSQICPPFVFDMRSVITQIVCDHIARCDNEVGVLFCGKLQCVCPPFLCFFVVALIVHVNV